MMGESDDHVVSMLLAGALPGILVAGADTCRSSSNSLKARAALLSGNAE